MKKKEFTELKSKDKKTLSKMVSEKRVELIKFTTRMYAGREKNLKRGKMIRRDIAQILTIVKGDKV
jgi:ribosomal protein L29